jgi:hypothetical protein
VRWFLPCLAINLARPFFVIYIALNELCFQIFCNNLTSFSLSAINYSQCLRLISLPRPFNHGYSYNHAQSYYSISPKLRLFAHNISISFIYHNHSTTLLNRSTHSHSCLFLHDYCLTIHLSLMTNSVILISITLTIFHTSFFSLDIIPFHKRALWSFIK